MKINWENLKDAFTFSSDDMNWYLDTETGKTIFISEFDPEAGEVTPDDLDNEPGRYVSIEPVPSHEAYDWMAEFVEGLDHEDLQEKLWIALDGNGAFRRFKDVLLKYPEQREAWFRFEDDRINEAVEEWLEEEGLEPDGPPPWRSDGES